MSIFTKIASIKLPKTVTGLLTIALGIGISAIPVPGVQAVGAKVIMAGGATVLAGLTMKGVKAAKAKKGERWMAVTENERESIKKMRKKKEK